MVKKPDFKLLKTSPDSKARAGELITPHGVVPTPLFLSVGSQGMVKTVTPDELRDIGIKMILANAYHLYLRPGVEVIKRMGGLHRFIGWDGAILTDSGGYQIFSLARLREVTDEGVVFRSHIDGSQHFISPELDIQMQEAIGADIIMVLDEVAATSDDFNKVKRAMERTLRWAERCQKAQTRSDQALFAIVQGGLYPELRNESANYLTSLEFDGYAIGGLSLGETKEKTQAIINETIPLLPGDKPRYLMGVGSPEDIVDAVGRGIDIFDCVLPTRLGRNGAFFTREGRRNIRNSSYSQMEAPIERGCNCYTCRNFSAAYLHHLFKCEELLAYRLATIHNLTFISNLMQSVRVAIMNGTFESFKNDFLTTYQPTDEKMRVEQKQKWLEAQNNKGIPED